jgi:hypothetical protein
MSTMLCFPLRPLRLGEKNTTPRELSPARAGAETERNSVSRQGAKHAKNSLVFAFRRETLGIVASARTESPAPTPHVPLCSAFLCVLYGLARKNTSGELSPARAGPETERNSRFSPRRKARQERSLAFRRETLVSAASAQTKSPAPTSLVHDALLSFASFAAWREKYLPRAFASSGRI